MIRMVLLAVGFVAITIALVVFQPGSNRAARLPDMPSPVTRAEPALDTAPVQDPLASAVANGLVQTPAPQPAAPKPQIQPQTRVASAPAAGLDDQTMRRMTWDTLSNLNQATGHEKAPGQPGSLLHTIVRRSLNEPAMPAPAASAAEGVYIVQPGDSLVSIAERVYGDVNMTGPLFAANQSKLTRPDDLRPGQQLVLPAK
ncbi:LysM peptidoglycan-binding domain-containing protein [Tropicibacter sp. S64]|uniref:LysM peptidoglycan-binding domain-containing protein n=1 Tax=Tropicibacter sp. S64 TaxID=3415122 RepID=UPI003C7A52C4